MPIDQDFFSTDAWFTVGRGPRYQQLHRHISEAIRNGQLGPDDQLPSERDLAQLGQISRITVRKAVAQLVDEGLIEQRRGAGSFVRSAAPKLEQSLSSLVSFTENMRARGMTSDSQVLSAGLHSPNQVEMLTLGVSAHQRVARITRLRSAGGAPMALEHSTLPDDVLPDPSQVKGSLYAILRKQSAAPSRAIQRVTALNVSGSDAQRLGLPDGAAVLKIERTGYLATGRPIEFTSGLYRPDIYDFVSELRHE